MTAAGDLSRLVERLGRLTHVLQYSTGLNPSQWEALRYLARANRYSASPSALARFLGCTKGTVSQTVIALESKGFVRRVRGRPDGRSVHLEVTAAGRALLGGDPLQVIEEAGQALPEDERAAMIRGMNRLLDRLCTEKGSAGFGMCGDCVHLDTRPCADAGNADKGEGCVCGLTEEPLRTEEVDKLCVNFRATS
jgi:DNA-binding MarR family transcriptional regulator